MRRPVVHVLHVLKVSPYVYYTPNILGLLNNSAEAPVRQVHYTTALRRVSRLTQRVRAAQPRVGRRGYLGRLELRRLAAIGMHHQQRSG